MARASVQTLLSLDRFSKLLGIAPPHFGGAYFGTKFPVLGCSGIWYQHNWQGNDRVSREELAQAIDDAEEEIAQVLGYWPAPTWTAQEVINIPHHWRRDMASVGNLDAREFQKAIKTRWGKVNAPGIRAVCFVDDPRVAYTDADGDTLAETATVTCGTVFTDESEVKVYFKGHNGEPEWEIRPARSVSISGGVFTATFYAWQLINPALWEVFPGVDEIAAIDASNSANLVADVDVYREYTDSTAVSAQFYWAGDHQHGLSICAICGGIGCEACNFTTQCVCFSIIDPEIGLIVPTPAAYDSDYAQWGSTSWTVCRTPDFVKVWYQSGAIDQKWLASRPFDPLPDNFALAIAWLAVARLHRPLCSCGNVDELVTELQRDFSITAEGKSKFTSVNLIDNPFGTKTGEVRAWQKIKHLSDNLISVGVI